MNQNINTLDFSSVVPRKLLDRVENKDLNDDHYGILVFFFLMASIGNNNPDDFAQLLTIFMLKYDLDPHLFFTAFKRTKNDVYRSHIIEMIKNKLY